MNSGKAEEKTNIGKSEERGREKVNKKARAKSFLINKYIPHWLRRVQYNVCLRWTDEW